MSLNSIHNKALQLLFLWREELKASEDCLPVLSGHSVLSIANFPFLVGLCFPRKMAEHWQDWAGQLWDVHRVAAGVRPTYCVFINRTTYCVLINRTSPHSRSSQHSWMVSLIENSNYSTLAPIAFHCLIGPSLCTVPVGSHILKDWFCFLGKQIDSWSYTFHHTAVLWFALSYLLRLLEASSVPKALALVCVNICLVHGLNQTFHWGLKSPLQYSLRNSL